MESVVLEKCGHKILLLVVLQIYAWIKVEKNLMYSLLSTQKNKSRYEAYIFIYMHLYEYMLKPYSHVISGNIK